MIVTPNHPVYGMTHRLFDLFDADGFEIVLCLWADTETGEAVVAVTDGGRLAWGAGSLGGPARLGRRPRREGSGPDPVD